MGASDYRHHLRAVVASSAAPYGYTLTLWTAGAIATHAEGAVPSTADALLLLTGAAIAFGAVGTFAYGGVNAALAPAPTRQVRVWGGMHIPSVGVSILLVSLIAHWIHGHPAWLLVGFVATGTYLLMIGLQFWIATHRPSIPSPD